MVIVTVVLAVKLVALKTTDTPGGKLIALNTIGSLLPVMARTCRFGYTPLKLAPTKRFGGSAVLGSTGAGTIVTCACATQARKKADGRINAARTRRDKIRVKLLIEPADALSREKVAWVLLIVRGFDFGVRCLK